MKTFAEYEKEGWQGNAKHYDAIDTPATAQAIEPILDSLGPLEGKRVLEIACGTGELAKATVARGAHVTGVDIATEMLEISRRKVPQNAEFVEGDAEALQFDTNSFDSATCSFGLLHLSDPELALKEIARVVKPGGRCAFTVWHSPADGNEFMGMILQSFEANARMDVDLPPAPPMFALADESICRPMLEATGFQEASFKRLPITWPITSSDAAYEFVLKGAVRTRLIFDLQTEEIKNKIRDDLIRRVQTLLNDGVNELAIPAELICATVRV